MKRLFLTLTVVTVLGRTMYGQGRVSFNNESTFAAPDAITVGTLNQGPTGGNAGDGIGGDNYSIQLLWVPGPVPNQFVFNTSNPSASAAFTGPAVFLANTGPRATFSGYFDAGIVNIGAPGLYTMQVLAWFNTGFATYDLARFGGKNTGQSALFTVNVTVSPSPINSTVFPGFPVRTIPEPSSLALAILGGTVIFLLRRKKQPIRS